MPSSLTEPTLPAPDLSCFSRQRFPTVTALFGVSDSRLDIPAPRQNGVLGRCMWTGSRGLQGSLTADYSTSRAHSDYHLFQQGHRPSSPTRQHACDAFVLVKVEFRVLTPVKIAWKRGSPLLCSRVVNCAPGALTSGNSFIGSGTSKLPSAICV